jgi:dCTP deaminase
MFLSDNEILKGLEQGDITISGFEESRLNPASYDILLGNKFMITDNYSTPIIDPSKGIVAKTKEVELVDGKEFILHPGVSVLGVSKDFFGAKNDYLIQLSGKSSLARIGLIVHNTAGLINPGHFLHITLELCNLNSVPIILRPGMSIAQLLFSKLSSIPNKNYEQVGRYGFGQENWGGWKDAKNS